MNVYEGRDEMLAHAMEELKHMRECCGLIVCKGKKQVVVRCQNASTEPYHRFMISPADFRAAEEQGDIIACYHSHIDDGANPSDGDKTMSEAHHLPFIVYSTSADAWSIYQPQGWRAALEGRPFFHGILDCYTLVKDYYDIKLGIKLADFYRPDDWWKTGANMYLEHSKEQGFMEVASPLHVHDVLLMHWQSQVPNHAAVYVEPGLILHHAPGRISGKSPYGGFYAEQTYGIFRHKSLL